MKLLRKNGCGAKAAAAEPGRAVIEKLGHRYSPKNSCDERMPGSGLCHRKATVACRGAMDIPVGRNRKRDAIVGRSTSPILWSRAVHGIIKD